MGVGGMWPTGGNRRSVVDASRPLVRVSVLRQRRLVIFNVGYYHP
jgi:hypothetical protein